MPSKQLLHISLFFFLSLCFLNCSTYKSVDITKEYDSNNMAGHCFVSEITTDTLEGEYQDAFILEYHDPVFKTEKIILSKEELLKYQYKDSLFRIVTMFGGIKYINVDYKLKQYYKRQKNKKTTEGLAFCIVEVPNKYKTYSFAELEKLAFTIEQKKIKKESFISKKHIKNKPENLNKNQHYYEAGYYTSIKKKLFGSDPYPGNASTRKIQEALNKLGYKVEVNNIMNDETKAALMDLQKKNGLPKGSLNMETLRFLGLQH